MPKTLERTKGLHVVSEFFKQFSKWCTPGAAAVTLNDLEKYISKDLQMYNNGKQVARSSANYLERVQKFQKKYAKFQVSEPIEEPLVNENRASIYYKVDLTTQNGQHKQVFILGMFTLENDKISHWVEVSNEKDASALEA